MISCAGRMLKTCPYTLLVSPMSSGRYCGSRRRRAVGGERVPHRADLYAAGAVLYQLLSGRPPYLRFADTDLWELIHRVRTEPPQSIRQLRPETSPAKPVTSPVAVGPMQTGPVSSPSPPVAVKPTIQSNTAPPPASPPPSPSPQPVPTQEGSGQAVPPKPTNAPGVLLADNFDRPEIGQLSQTSQRPSDYRFSYDDGEYVITKMNAALQVAPIVIINGPYDNTVIAVDVRLVGDVASRYAFLVCRNQSTAGGFTGFQGTLEARFDNLEIRVP